MDVNAHPEIARYRKHLAETPQSAVFMLSLERQEYERQLVEALTQALPRLYAMAYEDQTTIPGSAYMLMDQLERELHLSFDVEPE